MLKGKPASADCFPLPNVCELTTGQTTSQGFSLSPHLSGPAFLQPPLALHRVLGLPLPLAPSDLRRALRRLLWSQHQSQQLLLQRPARHPLRTWRRHKELAPEQPNKRRRPTGYQKARGNKWAQIIKKQLLHWPSLRHFNRYLRNILLPY